MPLISPKVPYYLRGRGYFRLSCSRPAERQRASLRRPPARRRRLHNDIHFEAASLSTPISKGHSTLFIFRAYRPFDVLQKTPVLSLFLHASAGKSRSQPALGPVPRRKRGRSLFIARVTSPLPTLAHFASSSDNNNRDFLLFAVRHTLMM